MNETVEKKVRIVQQTMLTALPCKCATPCGKWLRCFPHFVVLFLQFVLSASISYNSEDYGNVITTELCGFRLNEMAAVASVMKVRVACCVKQ